jgi:hypothetical protein
VTINQLLHIRNISIGIQARSCGIIIIFYSQLLHPTLIHDSHVISDENTIHKVLKILYTPLHCRSFHNSVLCVKHTESMLYILSILTLLNCEILLLSALSLRDATDQSSPRRIDTIDEVISHIVFPTIDCVFHFRFSTLS